MQINLETRELQTLLNINMTASSQTNNFWTQQNVIDTAHKRPISTLNRSIVESFANFIDETNKTDPHFITD